MELNTWVVFVLGSILICGSPGANMIQVMNSSIRYGLKPTLFTMFGCFSALLVMIAASMVGVGVFFQTYPTAFDLLRYVGAVYLVYLGVVAWKESGVGYTYNGSLLKKSEKEIFYSGFLVGISNPKALLFSTAFFPQFINQNSDQAVQFIILLVTFAVIEFSWYIIYAISGRKLVNVMKNNLFRKMFDRFIGTLFVLFGSLLILKPR